MKENEEKKNFKTASMSRVRIVYIEVRYMKFKECNSTDDFLRFFNNNDLSSRHTNFYHYTSIINVDQILKSKQLRLTPLSKSANDLVEREYYEHLGNNIFSLCLSTGTSESLPLWYLYSGIDGCGARIGLKKKTFCQIVESPVFQLIEVEAQYPCREVNEPITLQSEDYTFLCRDILYIGQDPQKINTYRIKYNSQVINDISKDTADKLQHEYQRFVKGLIWFYEKETRIQVEITNTKLLDTAKSYVVALKLDNIYEDLLVRLAPELGEINADFFDEYDGIRDWAYTKLQKSDFSGQLKMDLKSKLCRECNKSEKDK